MKILLIVALVGSCCGCATVDNFGRNFFAGAAERNRQRAAYYQTPNGQMYLLRNQLYRQHRETIHALYRTRRK